MGQVLRVSFGKREDAPSTLKYGDTTVHLELRRVERAGVRRRIEPRAAEVLAQLIAAGPAVVSREALLDACWSEAEGSDEALTQAVAQLRRVLGDDPRAPRFIETVPKVGYRWVAVEVSGPVAAPGPARVDPPRRRRAAGALMAAGLAAVAGIAGVGTWRVVSPPSKQLMLVQETVTYRHGADGRLIEARNTSRTTSPGADAETIERFSRLKTFSTP